MQAVLLMMLLSLLTLLAIAWLRFCFIYIKVEQYISRLNKFLHWITYHIFLWHLISIPFMLFSLVFLVESIFISGCLYDRLQFSRSLAHTLIDDS